MGRPSGAKPINWRPLDTRKLTPAGVEPQAVLHLQLDTAAKAEVQAEVAAEYPDYKIEWINPANLEVKARVIDERSGRVIKELQRNQPGGASFIFNESGYDFNFVLSDKDLSMGAPIHDDRKGQRIFDRLAAAKGAVGMSIEVAAYLQGRGVGSEAKFALDVKKLGQALKGAAEWEEAKLIEQLWNSQALTPPRTELTEKLVAAVEAAVVARMQALGLIESEKEGTATRYKVKAGLENLGMTLQGSVMAGVSETIRFSLDSLL